MMFNGKTALVTGGAGAIGSRLSNELVLHGAKVIVLDNLSSGHEFLVPRTANTEFIHASILDDDVLDKVFVQPVDYVFHCAAHFANQNSVEHPEDDLLVNALGTLKLLQRSSHVKRFIYISSSCLYGNVDGVAVEESRIQLDTPYAISKFAGEQYSLFYHAHYRVPVTILRIFNSFGPGELPGDYRNVIPNFFARAMRGESLVITGTGDETRDFNWVGNAVQAMLRAAKVPAAVGNVFNIASGHAIRISELAEQINSIVGNKAPLIFEKRRTWDHVLHRKADISKARTTLGYEPEESLKSHLEQTYKWLEQHVKS